MRTNPRQVIVIGGGPAGIAAAIQLKRYGLEPLLLEKRQLGGLLWNANLVENYPGFPNGVRGEKLAALMKQQVERLGVDVGTEEAARVDWQDDHFEVLTDTASHSAQYLVIAAGSKARPLPGGIAPQARARVFTEVWPLAHVTGKHIVIIGAGDAAFDYAINLAHRGNFATILNRGKAVKCLGLLAGRAAQEARIAYFEAAGLQKISCGASGALELVSEARTFHADYALFAIGREPNLDFLPKAAQEAAPPGRLLFAGDVKNGLFRQAAIAAGDGLRAAMQVYFALQDSAHNQEAE
ncbi:MAG: NAD(P)/FAD-dependent oxidoreductase [Chloroflexota bacterium]